MKKITKIILLIICLVIIGAVFLPIYLGASCTLSPEQSCRGRWMNLLKYVEYRKNVNLERSLEGRVAPLPRFPDSIGEYHLVDSSYYTRIECGYLREENVCLNITLLEYRNDLTQEVVQVSLMRAIKGKETLLTNKDRYFTPAEIDGLKTGWSGYGPRFTWFPQKDVHIISVNEGVFEYRPNEDYTTYVDKTTGTSLVTTYLLNMYPPDNTGQ